eukprot:TRINITY_DN5731_c0_g1_i3.p1 TRINITY_DN5731_c0_g1~~TRINITY_DN5731_c0_g1_i3.p1  ORF type:complete len:156 (-),score=25.75 TRINITY_DN5731_c0_g1_i3:353-820(-)
MKWNFISMCFVLACMTGFFEIAMAEALSHSRCIGFSIGIVKSSNNLSSHTNCWLAKWTAMYSASAVERATQDCFLLAHEKRLPPRSIAYPVVLFQSSRLPAQSGDGAEIFSSETGESTFTRLISERIFATLLQVELLLELYCIVPKSGTTLLGRS